MRKKFIVEVAMPPNVTSADMKQYIADAVATWKGSYRPPCSYDDNDPGDPIFHLDGGSVKVTHAARLPGSQNRRAA